MTCPGRSPGSRVIAFLRLPGPRWQAQWQLEKGLAADSCGGSSGIAAVHARPSHRIPFWPLDRTAHLNTTIRKSRRHRVNASNKICSTCGIFARWVPDSSGGKTAIEDAGQASQQSPEQQAGERDGSNELTRKSFRNVGVDVLEVRSADRMRQGNEAETEKDGPRGSFEKEQREAAGRRNRGRAPP